jgi:hypothetical protein
MEKAAQVAVCPFYLVDFPDFPIFGPSAKK